MKCRSCAVLALVAACGNELSSRPAVVAAAARRTDTVFVTTPGDGAWGPARDAEVVLRVPGNTLETTFGFVSALAPTPDGGVIVFDAKGAEGRIIRKFDANGKFVRNFGREGKGPGEYRAELMFLAVHDNGTVVAFDDASAIIRYAPDGRFLNGFRLDGISSPGLAFVVAAPDGSIYLGARYPAGAGGAARLRAPILRHDTTGGVLDTIALGAPWVVTNEPRAPYGTHEMWLPLEDGRVVVGRTDKFAILVVDPAGKSPPLVAEHAMAAIPYSADEIARLKSMQGARVVNGERLQAPTHPIPATKQVVTLMRSDGKTRVWLPVTRPALPPRQPVAFGAFETDGTYLGELRFPPRTMPIAFGATFAWGVMRDEDDVQVLVKFRVPERGSSIDR